MRFTVLARVARGAVAALALGATAAQAQAIHNTGTVPGGSSDPYWGIYDAVTCFTCYYKQAVSISPANLASVWVTSTTANWVSWFDDVGQPTGLYRYQTTFDLTGYDPSTATLSGRWAADDVGSLYLNDNLIGIQAGNWSNWTSFSVSNPGWFLPGVNTLYVDLAQADGYYDAVIVDQLSVTADLVSPEPATLSLLVGGLAAAGLVRLRRRA